MAYRYGNREQMVLLPASIEEYVAADDPVRAYDAFIEMIGIEAVGIEINSERVGNSSYDPEAMLKLLVYSYSYGWRSARKIERALHHNVSFMWLTGGLKPDYKTISEFRRKNRKALKKLLKQCARMCMKLDLIEGNILFVDGTKVRANASRNRNYTKEHYTKTLKELDGRIEQLLDECERIDTQEEAHDSIVKMREELSNNETLRTKIQELLQEFEPDDAKSKTINIIDPESRLMKSLQGSHASYNVQGVVDDKHGLIVQTDATDSATDHEQLSKQVNVAHETLGKKSATVSADAGYSDVDDLAKVDAQGITVVVPNQEQVSEKEPKPFNKKEFIYDEKTNQYICPKGHYLKYSTYNKEKNQYIYRITSKKLCKVCEYYGTCTRDKKGRTINRLMNEKLKEKLALHYETPEGQDVYARRKMRVEHPFGHIKRNLGFTQFLLRGKEKVNAEFSIAATCFNIARMITLFGGVEKMIATLTALDS